MGSFPNLTCCGRRSLSGMFQNLDEGAVPVEEGALQPICTWNPVSCPFTAFQGAPLHLATASCYCFVSRLCIAATYHYPLMLCSVIQTAGINNDAASSQTVVELSFTNSST